MLNFLIQKQVIKNVQKYIDKLEPKVTVHIPEDLPIPSARAMKKMCDVVSCINGLESKYAGLTDEQLQAKTPEFKSLYEHAVSKERDKMEELLAGYNRATDADEKNELGNQYDKAEEIYLKAKKKVLNDILPDAFAVVREAGKRVLNMRHFDVQMIGGIVLNDGNIAEMTTGEGKTLVATLPAYLNGLTKEGVHIVTVNDYLAKRDRAWMGPLFEFLGLSVGVILRDLDPQHRQHEYNCDISYATNNELGFDYLRDNMVNFKEDMVQRRHHFAIVDEVDSILVDEARTPLIISGPAEESTDKYYRANEIAKQLKGKKVVDEEKSKIDAKYKEVDLTEGFDYIADEKTRGISMTEAGEEKAAKMFGIDNLHDMETIEYRHHILQALKAREFFKIDVDYVLRDGGVIIVDEFTGRLMPGRRWSDGLHQAVEAKEGIKIERENQTLATITFQNYFRLYEKLSGMTGTAYTEATEFKQIYDLDCIVLPTNKKVMRKNYPDCIYRSLREKYKAIVEEVSECYKRGQPVLVGTISIEKSELLSKMMAQKGIEHQVLNAKYHEQEAHIIAQAGRFKGITIATNMAGRGTDIVLGGNAKYLADNLVEKEVSEAKDEDKEIVEKMVREKFIEQFRVQCEQENAKVKEQGGLHVLGTERHESRRIDNQLRGRQGRQGDPGSSRFYVSLEDDLMRLFASDKVISIMDSLGMEEGQVLEHPWLSKSIETAQKRVETHNFEIRKHLLEYDNVMNKQREVIYDMRRSILERNNVKDIIFEDIEGLVEDLMSQYLRAAGEDSSWNMEGLKLTLKTKFDYDLEISDKKLEEVDESHVKDIVFKGLKEIYKTKEELIGYDHLRHLEKMLLLHTIDSKWKDHLYAMDQLKEGIGLRSFAQRDPLIEYKREGFEMFQVMHDSIGFEVAETIFKIQPAKVSHEMRGVFSSLPQKMIHDSASGLGNAASRYRPEAVGGGIDQIVPPPVSSEGAVSGPKIGRNDPCPCGSGKKYKKCCGR